MGCAYEGGAAFSPDGLNGARLEHGHTGYLVAFGLVTNQPKPTPKPDICMPTIENPPKPMVAEQIN